jgi:hypothetical protein
MDMDMGMATDMDIDTDKDMDLYMDTDMGMDKDNELGMNTGKDMDMEIYMGYTICRTCTMYMDDYRNGELDCNYAKAGIK